LILIVLLFCFIIPIQNQVTLPILKEHLLLSYTSYCGPTLLPNFTCYWCRFVQNKVNVTNIFYSALTDTFGYIAVKDDVAFIIFRGTVRKSIPNWIVDLAVSKESLFPGVPNAKVHSGFLNAYFNIRDEMLFSIKRLLLNNRNIKTIKFMGHSLGGAIATIAAVDSQLNFTNTFNYEVWTFGSPRIGDKEFVNYFKSHLSSYRITNQKDIVIHYPPRILGFKHIPREYWFAKNNEDFKICDQSGEDPYCADSVSFPTSIIDHLTYLGYNEQDGHKNGCFGENPSNFKFSNQYSY